jgi:hypothetical protein
MAVRSAHHPLNRSELYRFDDAAAVVMACATGEDGTRVELLRTGPGRWVWKHISDRGGEREVRWDAATGPYGCAFDAGRVEDFLIRHGDGEHALSLWLHDTGPTEQRTTG